MDEAVYLGNTLRDWLIALLTAAAVYAGLLLIRRILLRHLKALSGRTVTQFDDLIAETIERTTSLFLLFVALYAGAQVLTLAPAVGRAARIVGVVMLALQASLWGTVLITSTIRQQMQRRLAEDPGAATTINALGFVGRLALYVVVGLIALENLGVDVTALVTGLGIGGVAVALALQNVLGDLFGSLSIVLDRPFVIGDFISVGPQSGTVEYIGLKTTRIRSLSGEQIVFSNSDLLASRIQNFRHLRERRVLFRIGVTYDTPRAQLEQIPGMLRAAVTAQPNTRFDRAHFASFGAYAQEFEVVYYVTVPDYSTYMDIQQAINLQLHRDFEEAGIQFAFPTQTIQLTQADVLAGSDQAMRDRSSGREYRGEDREE